MTSNDIYAILASKPHNPHYLKRYFKFIQWCQQNPTNEEYTEEHHICPKADDLFPEYKSLYKNPWNAIKLSAKQHIIAHIFLWKSYGDSQSAALTFIFSTRKVIPSKMMLDAAAKSRIDANEVFRKFWTNRKRYMTPDGIYHGSYLNDDPIIKQLNLIPLRTKAQSAQNASRTDLATAAKLGTKIYNNGLEERFLVAPIDDSWILGRLPYSEEGRKNQKDATRAACKGKKTYNNGVVNRFFGDDEIIPKGFVRGMKPRK